MKTERLRIENGQAHHSVFGGLEGIYLSLLEGQVLGALFDNIHAKETFIRILRGDVPVSAGRIYLNESLAVDSQTLIEHIHVVHRRAALVGSLSICENVYYAQLPPSFLSIGIYEEMLLDLMDQFCLNIPIHRPVDTLSPLEALSVELLKALALQKKVVILADITSYLSPNEIEQVSAIIFAMQAKGFSFLIVESFLNLLLKLSGSIAVIRAGHTAGFFPTEDLHDENMQKLFGDSGKRSDTSLREMQYLPSAMPAGLALAFESISTGILHEVSFTMNKGELLHVQCLDGKSYEEFIAVLRGERAPQRGAIWVEGKPIAASSLSDVSKSGVCIMEDNPHARAVLHHMTMFDNIAFALSKKLRFLWLRPSYQQSLRQEAAAICEEDLWQKDLRYLTPVQLQKIAYCKWILYRPSVLVCLNPFTGTDYQIDSVTERMIREMMRRNIAVLIITAYLPDTSLVGKTYTMRDGKLSPS